MSKKELKEMSSFYWIKLCISNFKKYGSIKDFFRLDTYSLAIKFANGRTAGSYIGAFLFALRYNVNFIAWDSKGIYFR